MFFSLLLTNISKMLWRKNKSYSFKESKKYNKAIAAAVQITRFRKKPEQQRKDCLNKPKIINCECRNRKRKIVEDFVKFTGQKTL